MEKQRGLNEYKVLQVGHSQVSSTDFVSTSNFEQANSCLINSDLCRHIVSFCDCRDLLRLEIVSKHWKKIVTLQFHEIRHHENNYHLIFKSYLKYESDKKICSRLHNHRILDRSEIFLLGGALHSNCKTTYMFVDRPVPEQQLYGGSYGDASFCICASAGTSDNAGHYLLLGGWNTTLNCVVPLVQSFDLSDSLLQRTQLPDLPVSRCFAAAESTIQGHILHIGGGDSPFAASTAFADSLIRKCGEDQWQAGVVPNMHQVRCGHRAVTLFNDSILVAGGYAGQDTFLDSVELLDSQLDRWTTLPSMKVARSGAASVVGPGGAMYMAGGTRNTIHGLKSLERFDPREGKWSLLAEMNQARSFVAGCQSVHDGFYVMGGMDDGKVMESIEFYDFRANKWNYAIGSATDHCYELNKVTAYMALRL